MSDILVFRSKGYLHYKYGEYPKLSKGEPDSKRIIVIGQNEKSRNSFDVAIFKGEEITSFDEKIMITISQMRIMEKSQKRILLQDWYEDEETCLPISYHGIVINYKDNEVFNCILKYYKNGEDYIFLNDSELEDCFQPWTSDLYEPNKNGVFTERLMNNHSIKWTFVNNQKHGEWKAISPNGVILEIGNYKFGKPEGEYKEFYGNGKVRFTWNYENGRRNGLSKYYNREGFVTLEGSYLNDKQVGKWVTYDEKGEFLSFEDFGEKGKPLFFGKDTHGSGYILCRNCGFEQKITSHIHNLPSDIRMTTWTGGYQCQLCGKFQARTSTPQKRDIDLNCECGGMISNKEPIFCPKCKSLDLEYHCTMMT